MRGWSGRWRCVPRPSSCLLLSSLELSDTQVYEPYIRALLGTASHFCVVARVLVTLVTGLRRSLSLKLRDTRVHEPQIHPKPGCVGASSSSSLLLSSLELSDTQVYEPYIRALLGTASHFCVVARVLVLAACSSSSSLWGYNFGHPTRGCIPISGGVRGGRCGASAPSPTINPPTPDPCTLHPQPLTPEPRTPHLKS